MVSEEREKREEERVPLRLREGRESELTRPS